MQGSSPLYVQYGCGLSIGEGWINFDNSPTLWLQRLPVLGTLASRQSGSVVFPAEVRYGDICAGLLVAPNSCAGIYASHVLEHLSFDDFRIALRNTYHMLMPGGLFRLIVPDLEGRARKYLDLLATGSDDANSFFMENSHLGTRQRARSVLSRLREQFGNSKHLWMWDERSMTAELSRVGFVSIRRCRFNDSVDGMFAKVEDSDRFFDETIDASEIAIECARPAQ